MVCRFRATLLEKTDFFSSVSGCQLETTGLGMWMRARPISVLGHLAGTRAGSVHAPLSLWVPMCVSPFVDRRSVTLMSPPPTDSYNPSALRGTGKVIIVF